MTGHEELLSKSLAQENHGAEDRPSKNGMNSRANFFTRVFTKSKESSWADVTPAQCCVRGVLWEYAQLLQWSAASFEGRVPTAASLPRIG